MTNSELYLLEKMVARYPWFSIGYLDIFRKICSADKDSADIYLQKAAPRVYSREILYDIYFASERTEVIEEPVNIIEEEIVLDELIDFVPDSFPKFILAGGDYFTKNDFEQVALDRSKPLDNFIAEKPALIRASVNSKSHNSQVSNEIDTSELFDDSSFYTETLASIYAEQGFYKRALDVYAKLILLYPEKSIYFASLVKNLKEKHNP